ncbi:MAG TPA: tripartite tricarboxylate transporter substrate binding protein [Casimicrobiaceae bacterium]|jgi:tripartite-type tricarboxylate transporter receptor subunit TctC|nr:tripartite tricarboxylate transporter substrate binding protein [Casimicrobiaceae bacterium]
MPKRSIQSCRGGATGALHAIAALAAMLWMASLALPAAAQTAYPDHTVKMLFGYPPGGGADIIARLCAESLREGLHQPVIVENRPGATGNIAAQAAAHAPADGYTIFFGTAAEIAINKQVMKDMGFDPDTDFVPVVLGFNVPLALVVSSKSPYHSLADLIDAAKKHPGTINYASSGSGTPGHLAGETLAFRTGTRMTHIPYKGGGPALTDIIGGHVDFYFAALNSVVPHIKAGTLRVLALSSVRRSQLMPDIPTVAELAVPGFDFTIWGGVFVPAKTPAEVVATLNRVVNEAYRRPEVKARLNAELSEAVANSPEQFNAFVRAEIAKYAQVVKEVGYTGQ